MTNREYVMLEDKNGKEVLPVTDGNGVFVEGGTKKLDKKLTEINEQLEHIANKGTTVEVLERVTKEEIDRQIQDGTIANLTLADESIESNKYKNKSIGLVKLDSDVIGKSYLANKTGSWASTILPVNKNFNSESIIKLKIKPLVDFSFSVRWNTNKGYSERQFAVKKGMEQDIESKFSITDSRILNSIQFGVYSGSDTAKFNAELLDIQLFLDGERTSIQEPSDSNGFTKIEDKEFILASKKFVQENIQDLKENKHTHTNKDVLDNLTTENNDLYFQGKKIGSEIEKKSIDLSHLNCNVLGTSYYVDETSDYAGFKLNAKVTGKTFRVKFKMELLQPHKGQYLRVYTDSLSGEKSKSITTPKLNSVQEYDVTLEYNNSVTTRSINIGAFGGNTVFNAYIRDLQIFIDNEIYTDLYKIESNSELIIKDDFILADKDYVTKEINNLNISDKLDRKELINKVAKGYRVAIRQSSYGAGIKFVFDDNDEINYKEGDEITLNFRCRYQSLSMGGLGLFNTINSAIISCGDFRNGNTIGYLRHYNDSVIASNKGNISDLRFDLYADLDFEIQDIYVKINDKVYYPKYLSYPETTLVEETPLVLDDNSIATKSFVEDLIGGIHKQDFELPFVNNIYTVKSSKNFFGVPIFLDYLYGEYQGTDRIIFDTDNDRQYVYPLRTLNKSMVNTKVNYKVKSETLNVPNVKFNHICIDENLNTDNIRLLIIGDSVTAGAITKQQYWSVCAEHFAKEDLIRNRDSKFMCLGSNNFRTTTVELNGKTKEVKAGACGISSWSLNSWLTNVSNTTNYDNPGGLNGFTYVENGVTKFSILKWIERFRNYDDNGNKLELGNGTGTWINANNINKVKCCTPNVIYINSTHNGGTIEQHEEIINIIKQELPNCKVIVGNPMPLLGSYYPDKYVDEWVDDSMLRELPNYGGEGNYLSTRLESLKYYVKKEKEDTTNSFYFMPQVVITPTIEGYEYDLVDNGFKQMKKITTQALPKEHPGTLTHKIWGYELYALLKYISGIEQGATNNFDTVPLFD